MSMTLIQFAYLASVCCFVVGLKKLASPKTARGGNALASLAMLIAIVATLFDQQIVGFWMIIVGLIIGSVIGAVFAIKVEMTGMPQMVAIFNGFGGLASALVALGEFSISSSSAEIAGITAFTVAVSILIGCVTFTGSLVAFGKLQGLVSSSPITYPMQNLSNGLLFVALIALLWAFTVSAPAWVIVGLMLLSLVLGVLLVIPIGGADMPVVVSLLNSYSGLAACATGFVLHNQLLIIAGSLVGAAGIILTMMMCTAMNRSLANVIFGAFGAADSTGGSSGEQRSVTKYGVEDAAIVLEGASQVVIVPGYGLAVARAQHITHELGQTLEKRGITVKYAIHPVAGRMPGHMNVLLAEADVPYEQLVEMDEINSEFEYTDVVLVLGANDVINPAAREPGSPISGMPILDVDKARSVMICKRSLSPGFAGIDNELFYAEKTMMLFGDAKKTVTDLVETLRNGQ
jgi:proton-translocating NAD(P)+ transhydrogenase subunit beta